MPSFNASCSEGFYDAATLSELRYDMLVRLGHAARASNPPQGMAELLNNFLIHGQRYLYRRYKQLETERYYSWVMTVGERFYGVRDNGDTCDKKLNAYKITGAFIQDLNNAWSPLERGIPATFYTNVDSNGFPARYEIRQMIEVFPAPAEEYTLWLRGHFGLLPFVDDTDHATIDSELLFLWALANAKNHYGQADASDIAAEAKVYLNDLIAASHEGMRYIPGAMAIAPATRPLFTGLDE